MLLSQLFCVKTFFYDSCKLRDKKSLLGGREDCEDKVLQTNLFAWQIQCVTNTLVVQMVELF